MKKDIAREKNRRSIKNGRKKRRKNRRTMMRIRLSMRGHCINVRHEEGEGQREGERARARARMYSSYEGVMEAVIAG